MPQKYHKYCRYELNEILPFIGEKTKKLIIPNSGKSHSVRLDPKRLLLILNNTKCKCCNLQGTHFWLERNGRDPHLNFYGTNSNGHEVMLTADHIIPKSKGGPHELYNMQLLCERCNQKKSDKIIPIDQLQKKLQVGGL